MLVISNDIQNKALVCVLLWLKFMFMSPITITSLFWPTLSQLFTILFHLDSCASAVPVEISSCLDNMYSLYILPLESIGGGSGEGAVTRGSCRPRPLPIHLRAGYLQERRKQPPLLQWPNFTCHCVIVLCHCVIVVYLVTVLYTMLLHSITSDSDVMMWLLNHT